VQRSTRRIATARPGITGVNEVLTMHFGPVDVLAVLSIDFDDALSALAVETTVSTIEREIKRAHPQIRRIFVEAQSREGHLRAQAETAPLETE
jgi:divalent metal cation (Fe/Co/Zn/Cd) transporter